MPNASPGDIAERAQRVRNKMLWLAPMLFFIWQGAFFSGYAHPHGPLRTVEIVSLGSHVFLAVVLLALLATGGGWKHGKVVRASTTRPPAPTARRPTPPASGPRPSAPWPSMSPRRSWSYRPATSPTSCCRSWWPFPPCAS
jgi:hypothetical protein